MQFEDVGSHGTKVIVYNLWLDEEGKMELDFDSDPEVLILSLIHCSYTYTYRIHNMKFRLN